MKKLKAAKPFICAIVVIAAVVFCLIYTRPQTLSQRYPYLDFLKCSEITGFYFVAPGEEDEAFTIRQGDAGFYELVNMISSASFSSKLDNLLPQGTKTYTYSDGDYRWYLILCFDKMALPDGSAVSGYFVDINNFFGDLRFYINGDVVSCTADNQKQWSRDIMDIISLYGVEE